MNYKLLLYILTGIVVIAALILIITIRLSQKQIQFNKFKIKNKGNYNFFTNSYSFFYKKPLFRRYLQKIRSRIEILELSDNWTINKKTMKFTYVLLGATCFLLFLVIILGQDLYYIIIGMLTIYIMHNQILKILVDKIDDKLLIQFEKFIGDIRHHYHEHGMIDEAIYDAVEECDYEISRHGDKMYEVLTSEDIDESLSKYYDLVPNKYFKTFLALCYTLQKFGDKIVDGNSMFLSNLNYLKQEINLEILRRKKLSYLFKSLAIIAIIPIFSLSAIESWGKGNLPELCNYYEGSYGFVVKIILFLLVIFCFTLINKLQMNQEQDDNQYGFEEKLLKNKFIAISISNIIQKHYGKSRKQEELLKVTGTKITIEGFYLRRILLAVVGFLIGTIIFVNIHHLNKKNILYTSQVLIMDNNVVNKEVEQSLMDIDREYIIKYYKKAPSYFQIEQELVKDNKINKKIIPDTAKRIMSKIKVYKEQYFKWWELTLCIIVGIIFYYIPCLILIFKRSIIYLSMEDEVMQFHTIILMLMNIERISVEDLLEWMSIFAVTFKDSINKCLNNYENGDIQALEQLKADEPFLPFKRIVENLLAASDRISIMQAFDELKIERGYYQEKRKQDNEIIINKKGSWGKIIAFIPFTGTLILYLIIPFIHLSITHFINYSNQIKSFL